MARPEGFDLTVIVPDQELIEQIRASLRSLHVLCREAEKRKIGLYVHGSGGHPWKFGELDEPRVRAQKTTEL